MIRCKKCGHVGEYTGILCPECNDRIALTSDELLAKKKESDKALSSRNYAVAVECMHILADAGIAEYGREYANILEKGEITTRNLDLAMKYFKSAAENGDSYSAYRYARLAGRHSKQLYDFWLTFSAVTGCISAYRELADLLSEAGDDDASNYYYALAAACDDTDAIVTLAKRYYNGTGAKKSEPYAKWYLDKLSIPPIHAIKMAYKLRSVKAEDPGVPELSGYDKMLRALAAKARELACKYAYFRLCGILSDRQDMQARMILGMLYADGVGTKQDTQQALDLLKSAAAHGHAEAYKRLGDIYLSGKLVAQNPDEALSCYKQAAALGMTNAYETMGDIFCEGKLVERDVPRALELYREAAKEGHSDAAKKADSICDGRERFLREALYKESTNQEDAFRLAALSVGMGYLPAYLELGRFYENGIGIKKDRARAFFWYKKARELGYAESLYPLGLCYARGIGTRFSFNDAIRALSLAKRYGDQRAEGEIARLLENKKKHLARSAYAKAMELIYQNKFADAALLLTVSLKTNDGKGIYTLGCLNEFGLGIPTDRERAFALYERAFELRFRDPRAVYKLKILRMARNYK